MNTGQETQSKPTALFLINSLAGGGAERVMTTLLANSEAERERFDIRLALLDQEPSAYAPPDWLPVHQLDCRGSLVESLRQVTRLRREIAPQVTVSFLTRANIANVAATPRGRPCVISERVHTSAHLGGGLGGFAKKAAVRAAYPRASKVVAVSEGVADDLAANFGVSRGRLVAIDNPVDLETARARAAEPSPLDVEGFCVVGMGRLAPNKNFELLIRAFHAAGAPGTLVILGEGPERPKLEALVAALGLGGKVRLPGFLANPFPVLKRADVFVLSSNAEGFPNSLVEAMGLGAPVIAVNCASGPAEILAERPREALSGIVEGGHGLVVPPNDVDAMAEALRRMLAPDVRRAYADKAIARAEAFGVARAVERYWSVIRSAAACS